MVVSVHCYQCLLHAQIGFRNTVSHGEKVDIQKEKSENGYWKSCPRWVIQMHPNTLLMWFTEHVWTFPLPLSMPSPASKHAAPSASASPTASRCFSLSIYHAICRDFLQSCYKAIGILHTLYTTAHYLKIKGSLVNMLQTSCRKNSL